MRRAAAVAGLHAIPRAGEVVGPPVGDAVALSYTLAAFQAQDNVRVLLDPAGHPFCLCVETDG